MTATKNSVLARIKEYDTIGRIAFLKKYTFGYAAKNYYLIYNNKYYDLKAIYASACNPPIKPSSNNSQYSIRELEKLGFHCVTDGGGDEKEFIEGQRRLSEIETIYRNKGLIALAKNKYGTTCKSCGFNFLKFYGIIGNNFIECHHLNPISQIGSNPPPVTVNDVTVLCANCHRMAHTSDPPLTVEVLRKKIADAKN